MTFTDKKPTVPGAYWWKRTPDADQILTVVTEGGAGELFMNSTNCTEGRVLRVGGLWSSRLVPVEEVERAYREGLSDSASVENPIKKTAGLWLISRARRVIEGKEPSERHA